MQVVRWRNSLALRLPEAIVKALDLKKGDNVMVDVIGERSLSIAKKPTPTLKMDDDD